MHRTGWVHTSADGRLAGDYYQGGRFAAVSFLLANNVYDVAQNPSRVRYAVWRTTPLTEPAQRTEDLIASKKEK